MTWRECRLGDFMRLQRGHDLPAQDREYGEVPVVSSSGITGHHSKAKAAAPGVVTGRYGTLGEVFFLDRDYWPLNTSLYVTDFKGNDPKFTAYFLRNVLKDYQSDKAAVPGIDRNVLHELKVRAPDLAPQLRIVNVLAAYDDLIDNNRRRIKLLEDSVRLLFDEWFVRQQVPPHLESWPEEEPLHHSVADLCVEVKAQVLPEAIDADTSYIGLEHMPRRSITLSDWGTATDVTSTKLRYAEGDIIFGKIRPYFHKVGIALTDGVCSSDAIVMRPRAESWRPLLLAFVSSDAFIAATAQGMKEGSKMPRADWKQMRAYSLCVPNQRVLSAFNGVVEPVLQQVKTLALQARALRTARDLLLPRLMSAGIQA